MAGHDGPARGHGVDRRRRLPDGLRPLLSGGGAGAHGRRRRLLDRRRAGHRRAVRALRRGDRARHRRRAAAGSGRLPRRRPRPPEARLGRVPARAAPGVAGRLHAVVGLRPRRELARPGRPGQRHGRPRGPSGDARRPRGRRRLRRLGRQGAADRGRVGVRRPRRPRRRHVCVGRRAHARRAADGQHLAGRVPVGEHRRRRLGGHVAGRQLPAQRLRPLRRHRQRLGVDRRLLHAAPSVRGAQPLLRPAQPARDLARRQLRVRGAGRGHPAQGDQGRVAPVCPQLLPALPTGRPPGGGDRHLHQPHRVPLRAARRVAPIRAGNTLRRT